MLLGGRDNVVSIAAGYVLGRSRGLEFEFRYCQESSLLHVVHTGSETHPAFYPMSTWVSFPESKVAET
jgi:hypothetical protein